jgi:hypothetical protein
LTLDFFEGISCRATLPIQSPSMNFIEEYLPRELSYKLSGKYHGSVVVTDIHNPIDIIVNVDILSEALVKVSFEIQNQLIEFRAILSESADDIHMIIQEKVTNDYILNGVRGFLCKKPNVHGGMIGELQGFYFHILSNHFDGKYREFYFFGKKSFQQPVAI